MCLNPHPYSEEGKRVLGHLWFHSVSHEGWLCLAQGIAMAVHFERHGGSTSSLMVNGTQCSVRQCNLEPSLKAPNFKL